jgi:hypothetical protein
MALVVADCGRERLGRFPLTRGAPVRTSSAHA